MITDKKIDKDANVAREVVVLHVQSVGNSEADTLFDSYKPGYPFEVEDVQHFAEGIAATASYDLKIGSTSALAAAETPTADTREDASLSTTLANLQGTDAEALNLHATTDGTGTFTGLKVKVTIRPRYMHGDPPRIL